MSPLRRRLLLLCPLLALAAQAEPPRQNLLVEMRWVESGVSGAVIAGSRQGGVVVGTAGSVSPRPGGTTLSTRRVEDDIVQSQQLLVLNGQTASVMLAETELLQWLDYGVELRGGSARPQPRLHAQSRSLPVERRRGFALTPLWPGGRQPARVELRALAPAGGAGETEILSTVQLALGEWVTVARRGGSPRMPEPGVISSRDAELQGGRELQIRVSAAP